MAASPDAVQSDRAPVDSVAATAKADPIPTTYHIPTTLIDPKKPSYDFPTTYPNTLLVSTFAVRGSYTSTKREFEEKEGEGKEAEVEKGEDVEGTGKKYSKIEEVEVNNDYDDEEGDSEDNGENCKGWMTAMVKKFMMTWMTWRWSEESRSGI
ncbi:hypothetical protein BC938DRAFT_483237 [Jimgerdemannia flammicorona]|uniref:Uncharacterized protein n=1 Tax=Jimgerdemannia flammicorona TaxID=994334 RepID=A0A433QCJ0_9FUNG|nr:hypothetical protein BC938DRAFT_483237 [Jimgerdemannia flammicorona]